MAPCQNIAISNNLEIGRGFQICSLTRLLKLTCKYRYQFTYFYHLPFSVQRTGCLLYKWSYSSLLTTIFLIIYMYSLLHHVQCVVVFGL